MAAQRSEASVVSIASSASERIPSGCLDKPAHIDVVEPPECFSHALAVARALAKEPVAPAEQHNLRKQLELGKKRSRAKGTIMKKPAKARKTEHVEGEEGGPYNEIIQWLPKEARPIGKRGKHSYTLKKDGCMGKIEVLSRPKFVKH